jgi:hypothetical protein
MHAVTQQAPETVGGLIDELFSQREQRRKLAETDKNLQAQYAELEARLIAALDLQETTQARGRSATATLNEEELATVTDWQPGPRIHPQPERVLLASAPHQFGRLA